MDYCNLDSEVAETLNYLRPPVLRGFRRTCRAGHSKSSISIESSDLLQDYRTKFSKRTQIPASKASSSITKEVSSSSSGVYKKTSAEKIIKKYSVLSYTKFQHSRKSIQHQSNSEKDKPLIQVTVIPKKSDHTSNSKLWKRIESKQPHITVSNQENSTKPSNVLVASGHQRERIYEVKATESAEVTSRSYIKNEQVTVDKVKNFIQLLDSLDMDKKKKKGKKQKDDGRSKKGGGKNTDDEISRNGSIAERNFMIGEDECAAYCSYPCASKQASRDSKDKGKDLKNRKSRVRITGRIGLTEDDQYVLRCAATSDDKPVITNVAQIPLPPEMFNKDFKLNKKDLRPYEEEYNNNNSSGRRMKDSNVQADFHIETSYDTAHTSKTPRNDPKFESSENYNTVTLSNIETLKIVSNKNAKIQFNGPGEIAKMGNHNEEFDGYDGAQYPNCCSNPVVIISVYPKQEPSEKSKVEKPTARDSGSKSPPRASVLGASQKTRTSVGAKPKTEKESRSPSPRSTRSPSPSPSPPPMSSPTRKQAKVKNSIVQTDSKTGRAKKKESAVQTPTTQPQTKDSLKESNKNSPRKFGSPNKIAGKKPANPNSAKAKSQEASTDIQMTKKALVDTYTKKITEQMERNPNKRYPAKQDVSNVTINIEGEHEFYDLMFHQGNQTTDLRVRRSVKDQGSQMHDQYDSPSLENFLLSENYSDLATRKRSFSQTFYEPSNDDLGLQLPIQSRLNVRDSIEISHRREKSCTSTIHMAGSHKEEHIVTRTSSEYNGAAGKLNVSGSPKSPVKHFQGDDCSILDPVQRDKEIRQLLGVKRSRSKPTTAAEVKSGIYNNQLSYYWCGNNCLLKEIEGSIDSYYDLSTSSTFEEQMNQVFKTSTDCIEANCQTSEVMEGIPSKSRARRTDRCFSILFKNPKTKKWDSKKPQQKKSSSQEVKELGHLKITIPRKPEGCSGSKQYDEYPEYPKIDDDDEYPGCSNMYEDDDYPGCMKKPNPYQGCSKKTNENQGCSKKSAKNPEWSKNSCGSKIDDDDKYPGCSKKTNENPGCSKKSAKNQECSKNSCGCQDDQDLDVLNPPAFQQIVLNRSINVYLEIKKFSKQKPIVLSRKQYDKVKKAIANCNLKKNSISKSRSCKSDKTERNCKKETSVCDGEPACHDEPACDDEPACNNEPPCHNEPSCYNEPCGDNQPTCYIEPACDDKSTCCICPDEDNVQLCNQTLALPRNYCKDHDELLRTCYYCGRPQSKINNYCYFCGMYQSVNEAERMFYQTAQDLPSTSSKVLNPYPTSRSMEIRYTSFAFVEFSSNNVDVQTPVTPLPSVSKLSTDSREVERSDSILTIFKGGRRKSMTPNLGTSSVYSLSTSEYSVDLESSLAESKSRKPLFRRLMSCLVMRSARVSPLKLARPIPKAMQSSVDSYHISTSLGAIEIGSSLYDTSASFYSNHTIQPITSKMRRGGFFTSIRGFLASKKSSRHQKDA